MSAWHIPEELLERFLRLEASQQESMQVVRHLLSGCPQCLELAHRAALESGLFTPLEAGQKAGWEQAYAEVFTRALAFATEEERKLALEKLRGWAQWAQIEPLNPQLRFVTVESDSRFHNFGLYDRLLEAARWYSTKEPAEAVDIVRLAILVVELLDPAVIGTQRLADLKAAAWAALGNTKRIANDFEGS